jgi:hypothetical protein
MQTTSNSLQSLLCKWCSKKTAIFELFLDEIMSKEAWSEMLGINRNTLRRWEVGIIKRRYILKLNFYDRGSRKYGYDGYQRFITYLICQLKYSSGDKGVARLTNKDVLKYFFSSAGEVTVAEVLSRTNFESFIKQERNNVA